MTPNRFKFRAWDKKNKLMIIPFVCEHKYISINDWFTNSQEPLTSWSLMQSTGLLDKKGKEIFEGDIIRIEHENSFSNDTKRIDRGVGVVEFGEYCDEGDYDSISGNGFYITSKDHPYYQSIHGDIIPFFNEKEIEIIGNIHENHELLK